jgi:6-pyruvoyltetrahydropterin/6-carboxytetrahydropterin synthase
VFQISVQAEFCAAHAIVINRRREPVHGHNWRVTATLEGKDLDDNGLLCDFHLVERGLREITTAMNNASLNDLPPFSRDTNPTAENVARHIGESLIASLKLPSGVRLVSISLTEAPGCVATYFVDKGAAR